MPPFGEEQWTVVDDCGWMVEEGGDDADPLALVRKAPWQALSSRISFPFSISATVQVLRTP